MDNKSVDYADKDYWDGRYKNEDHYEWLGESCYQDLLKILAQDILKKDQKRILILGCGTSKLSADIHELLMEIQGK